MSDADSGAGILVADDDPDVLFAVSELLKTAGFNVETASNGSDALRSLGERQFDALLSDIAMPDMDGIALLRKVRERHLDLPVVLMTGEPRMDTAIQAVEHGALRYLLKPVSGAALAQAMESAVRLHRVARWKREALVYLGAERKLVGDHAGLESSLAQAIDTLTIAFQPIVRASSGEIYGHEALVRNSIIALQHPTALFEAAERLGATQKLGRTIRARAAHSARTNGSESLFVNLHPTDLNDDELFSDTAPLSQRASSVVLEVTERTSLHTVSNLKGRIKTLRAMGFRIAVDDLGAGYAGLTSFAALEPDVVKLDMSIVRGVDADPIRRKLVSSMAAMCRELGILVVAEGVETLPEYQAVVELGCDLVQGFWTGRPIS